VERAEGVVEEVVEGVVEEVMEEVVMLRIVRPDKGARPLDIGTTTTREPFENCRRRTLGS
jgi:hypothetical protein